jgi:hypothetical protein
MHEIGFDGGTRQACRGWLRDVVVVAAAMAASVPANAAVSVRNEVWVPSMIGPDMFIDGRLVSTDGQPLVRTVARTVFPDGFATAQASRENYGTAIATAASTIFRTPEDDLRGNYLAEARTKFESSFDFPQQTKGRVTIKLSGWAIANGVGYASVSSFIFLNQTLVAQRFAASSEVTEYGGLPGFRKLNLSTTLNWKGGDTITIQNRAFAQAMGSADSALGISGPGFASAYIDPVFDVSAVPEPSNWALLIAGFGLVGAVQRRRRLAMN